MYPIDRQAYVNAYLSAMKEELEQDRFAREHGSEDDTDAAGRFFRVIADKLSHRHKSERTQGRWIPMH